MPKIDLNSLLGVLGAVMQPQPPTAGVPAAPTSQPQPSSPSPSTSIDLNALLPFILPFILALLQKELGKTSPQAPAPLPGRLDDDEPIEAPPGAPKESTAGSLDGYTVSIRIQKAQYNAKLFPGEYTDDNPFGLYPQDYLRQVEQGKEALNRSSKFWLDLTLRASDGREIGREEIRARGLAFKTRHEVKFEDGSVGFIDGKGDPNGEGADNQPAGFVGWGGAAWAESLGFNLACKAFGEGKFEASGSVAGIKSNVLKIRVS